MADRDAQETGVSHITTWLALGVHFCSARDLARAMAVLSHNQIKNQITSWFVIL